MLCHEEIFCVLISLQDGSEKYVLMIGISSIVGAWFGAFVIPLDWDRWWQVKHMQLDDLE